MSEGRNTELVSDLRKINRDYDLARGIHYTITRAADALESTSLALSEKEAQINALDQERDGFAQLAAKLQDELVGERWHADEAARQRDVAVAARDEALAALKAAEERVERLSQALASARCPQEPWRATPERITQKYLRRYPNSKAARSWAGCMVHISTEHGVWRINGQGYTRAGKFDAWVLPFEEAQEHVAHCGPEKEAAFIKVVQPIGSGPSLAGATNNPPSDPGTEQREAERG